MTSLIGQYLGQYVVTEPLSKGGMATVYRARQLNVDRDVAIKVLKPEFVKNPEFIKQFEREAKLIASLSHPHILKLFDYGNQGDIVYLVTELLPGGSLADRIKAGPLPLDTAGRIFGQMTQALDYAHRRGIIHRDLKPGNVLLDEDGNVFLVDFGIATLLSEVAEQAQTGLIVGTPTYIAPEQWLGLEVDARTDVYAIGVILYQMLAGKPPFVGDSMDSLLQQHLYEQPPPIHLVNPRLPPDMDQVIDKALAKAPADRFESAVALGNAFEAIVQSQLMLDHVPVVQPAVPVVPLPQPTAESERPENVEPELPAPRKKRSAPIVAAVMVVALALIAAGVAILSGRAVQPTVTPTVLAVAVIKTATSPPTVTQVRPTPTFTPTPTATPIPTITPNLQATISAGIAMTSTAEAIIVKNAATQTPVPTAVLPTATAPAGSAGKLVCASDRDGNWEIYVMDTGGQNLRNLTNNRADDTQPVWSPDGKHVAFISDRDGNSEIYVMDADGQNLRNLTNNRADDTQPAWSPDGKHIAFISLRDGHAQVYMLDMTGLTQRITNDQDVDGYPAWSPDGRQIAYESQHSGTFALYIMDLGTGKEKRLTNNSSNNRFPAWSPDGKHIAFISDRQIKWDIFVIDPDGKNERNLTNNPADDTDPMWSPDGKQIAFLSDRRESREIWLMDADGSNPFRLTTARRTNTAIAWSPDSKRLTFSSRSSGGYLEIYVMDANGQNQIPLTSGPGDHTLCTWQPQLPGEVTGQNGK